MTTVIDRFASVRANLFPGAHDAIADWSSFPWHILRGALQAAKPHSSQGLAIDVFGTIAAHPDRDVVLDALALKAEVAPGGPWTVSLEWCDPDNLLAEPRQTQVDALAVGAHGILVIECKFTETGGACSQTAKIGKGRMGAGAPQCDGAYRIQTNPLNGRAGRCALSAKGIRYWDLVPELFAIDAGRDHAPCPFSGEAFQWMRNMVLAHALGRATGKATRCVIAYAAGGGFPVEAKVGADAWLPPLRTGNAGPLLLSYQSIIDTAAAASASPVWTELRAWVDAKVRAVRAPSRGRD